MKIVLIPSLVLQKVAHLNRLDTPQTCRKCDTLYRVLLGTQYLQQLEKPIFQQDNARPQTAAVTTRFLVRDYLSYRCSLVS